MSQRTLASAGAPTSPFSRLVTTPVRGLFVCGCLCLMAQTNIAHSAERRGDEPGWVPVILARGALQQQIDATPIEERPYRPFHFYGNTIRRMYYRGTAMPRVGEVLALPVRAVTPRSRSRVADSSKLGHIESR